MWPPLFRSSGLWALWSLGLWSRCSELRAVGVGVEVVGMVVDRRLADLLPSSEPMLDCAGGGATGFCGC